MCSSDLALARGVVGDGWWVVRVGVFGRLRITVEGGQMSTVRADQVCGGWWVVGEAGLGVGRVKHHGAGGAEAHRAS